METKKPTFITLAINQSQTSIYCDKSEDLSTLQIEQKGILLTPKQYEKIITKLNQIKEIICSAEHPISGQVRE